MWISSLPSPQAVSCQPTAVLSPGLLSKTHLPTPSPHPHWRTHVSGWGPQGWGMDHLCRSHSVLLATDWLLCPPPVALEAPLLSQLISPPVRGLPLIWESLLSFSSPLRGRGPLLFPLLFLLPSSFFCPTRLHGDLSCPFRYTRSSVSVLQVLCENCSICKCILDAFKGRGERHSLLLLCHLGS